MIRKISFQLAIFGIGLLIGINKDQLAAKPQASLYKTTAKMCHIKCLEKGLPNFHLFDNRDETDTIRLLECYCSSAVSSVHIFTKRSQDE